MGVHGLWRLIEPSGKPVPLETLENKVLAVDISIWLHQAIKGFQDAKGAPLPNAHLLGIFHRVCKLLYYRIRPVFVFDGGVPVLKRQTIAKRNQLKSKNQNDVNRLQKQLLNSLIKHSAINAVLSEKAKASLENDIQKASTSEIDGQNDIFELPPSQIEPVVDENDEEDSSSEDDHFHLKKHMDLHTIDEKCTDFKSLPANVRHEILSELKETRKQSSWGRIHELPTQSDDFSGYQMKRLLKRHSVQLSLEEAEKEMGGFTLSLDELETLLNNHGVITSTSIPGRRIASDENKRYIYIKNVKEAMAEASMKSKDTKCKNINDVLTEKEGKNTEEIEISKADSSEGTLTEVQNEVIKSKADLEYENDLEEAIKLSLGNTEAQSEKIHTKSVEDDEIILGKKCDNSETSENENSVVKSQNTIRDLDNGNSEFDLKEDTSKTKIDDYETDLEEAIKLSLQNEEIPFSTVKNISTNNNNSSNFKSKIHTVYERDLQKAIKLSLQDEATTSNNAGRTNSPMSGESMELEDDDSNSSDSGDELGVVEGKNKILASAKSYMTEYSGLTPAEISKIIGISSGGPNLDLPKINSKTNIENDTKVFPKPKLGENKKINFSKLFIKPKMFTNKEKSMEKCGFFSFKKSERNLEQSDSGITDLIGPSDEKNSPKSPTVELMTDSDSSEDFLEVETPTKAISKNNQPPPQDEKSIQITIDKISTLEDDLFSDIFQESAKKQFGSEKECDLQNKPTEINDKTLDDNLERKKDKNIKNPEKTDFTPSTVETQNIPKESILLKEILKPSGSTDNSKSKLTTSELKGIQRELAKETNELIAEKSTKERLASSITDQMYQEAQELLQLFGVPYVIAPMEAEAQCAFMNEINLTDGTITDDSDVWLFGGKTVYKNFFNQSKHVLEFKSEEIQDSFKLSRHEMILLALLVGSDYTTGIQGIGPVTALEILAAFPPPKDERVLNQLKLLQGLREFRRWFGNNKALKPVRTALRNKLKNVEISDQFPSLQVAQAYLEPAVETSREPFSWEKPDAESLTEFARQKFGWQRKKSEEILKPILRRLEETAVQAKITNYFKTKHKIQGDLPQDRMSKRVKKAVEKIGNADAESPEETPEPPKVKETKKNLRKKSQKKDDTEKIVVTTDEDIKLLQQTKKFSRNRIKEMKIEFNEMLLKAEAASSRAEGVSSTLEGTKRLHRKETIPQKEKSKADSLRNLLKAVEVFRKSKQGPGYLKPRQKKAMEEKQDAELSENSD